MKYYIGTPDTMRGQKILLIISIVFILILYISTDLTSESLALYIVYPIGWLGFNIWASRFFTIYVCGSDFIVKNIYFKKIIIPINEFKEIKPFISMAGGYKIIFKNGRSFLFSQGSKTRMKYYFTVEFNQYIKDVTDEINGLMIK
jgi:hypothetical protein